MARRYLSVIGITVIFLAASENARAIGIRAGGVSASRVRVGGVSGGRVTGVRTSGYGATTHYSAARVGSIHTNQMTVGTFNGAARYSGGYRYGAANAGYVGGVRTSGVRVSGYRGGVYRYR